MVDFIKAFISPTALSTKAVNELRRIQSSGPERRRDSLCAKPTHNTSHSTHESPNVPSINPESGVRLRPFRRGDAPAVHMYTHADSAIHRCVATEVIPQKPYELFDAYVWCTTAAASLQRPSDENGLPEDNTGTYLAKNDFFYAISDLQTDEVVGCISAYMPDENNEEEPHARGESCEIGYWLGATHRRRGIMARIVRDFVSWLWMMYPKCKRIDAGVYSTWNRASEKVLESAGFKLEAKSDLRVWYDGNASTLTIYAQFREGAGHKNAIVIKMP